MQRSTRDLTLSQLKLQALRLWAEIQRRNKRRKLWTYYPEQGPLRRELYVKHMEFFRAGATHRERLMIAANRIGKTEGAGGFETVLHLTGLYPPWWVGKRFERPVRAWACGDTNLTVRDIVQEKLFGPIGELGSGIIPGDLIVGKPAAKSGLKDAYDIARVKHSSGGVSLLSLKSYEAGRKTFQGTEQDVIWLDEEPPLDVYAECLTRTMTTKGIVFVTFTPLQGLSDTVLHFLPGGRM